MFYRIAFQLIILHLLSVNAWKFFIINFKQRIAAGKYPSQKRINDNY